MADPRRPDGIPDYEPENLLEKAYVQALRAGIGRPDLFVRQMFANRGSIKTRRAALARSA